MSDYPLHDKLKAHHERALAIGEFLDFLDENDIVLARWEEGEDELGHLRSLWKSKADLIGEFLGIDPQGLEEEKQKMIRSIRKHD